MRDRDRQTHRQTNTETERQRDRKTETDRQIDRDTHRDREKSVGEQYIDWRRLVACSDEKPNSFPLSALKAVFISLPSTQRVPR